MIRKVHGNLLEADTEALVNTVNTVGVMGRGVALQFKRAFPENYKAYRRVCQRNDLEPGRLYVFDLNTYHNPRFIVNFPTKRHWKEKSKLSYIESGLMALAREIKHLGIQSIAIPPLGCGLGGLNWGEVYPEIEKILGELTQVDIRVYEPTGAPEAARMQHRTPVPQMTPGCAVLIGLMKRYLAPLMDDAITLLEIHKLMYLMQQTGEDLRLRYVKGNYGPYSTNLHHVLERIEGHFIVGYGDGAEEPGKVIELHGDAAEQAEKLLEKQTRIRKRLDHINELILGFETPYGMELLSSVHWVACEEDSRAREEIEAAVAGVHAWNDRKRRMFEPDHIRAAWQRLRTQGWLLENNPN